LNFQRLVYNGTDRLQRIRTHIPRLVVEPFSDLSGMQRSANPHNLFKLQDDIAGSMATPLAHPYGVIFRSDVARFSQ